jgi:hypothetical protein
VAEHGEHEHLVPVGLECGNGIEQTLRASGFGREVAIDSPAEARELGIESGF